MRQGIPLLLLICFFSSIVQARVVVFWQDGFPTVDSQPVSKQVLSQALQGMDPLYVGIEPISQPATLKDCTLLVLPYGSALPADVWGTVLEHLRRGGNLLFPPAGNLAQL
jgi:hypothetical protein